MHRLTRHARAILNLLVLVALVAASRLTLGAQTVGATMMPWDAPLGEFWVNPQGVVARPMVSEAWSALPAPDERVEYALVNRSAADGEIAVTDAHGQIWSVTPHNNVPLDEGSLEVVASRVLSAMGYFQPPRYFVRSFTVRDASGVHERGPASFRLQDESITTRSRWSWQRNPFVGMRPYQGLLVLLLLFDVSDLDSGHNDLYSALSAEGVEHCYVVGDLTTSATDAAAFARERFITGVADGFVTFKYHGQHQELIRNRITPDDVGWASFMLGRLNDSDWQELFRAAGYGQTPARHWITAIRDRIAQGRAIGGDDWP